MTMDYSPWSEREIWPFLKVAISPKPGLESKVVIVLPSLVSSMEQYYVKTCYPNQHHPSVAPADVYSHYTKRDEIENAVSNTKKLIKLIQRLF